MADGHLNYCQPCVTRSVRERLAADPAQHEARKAYMREWNRKHGKDKGRELHKVAYKRQWREANRERDNERERLRQGAMRARNPEQARAWQAARKGVPFTDEAKAWARVLLHDPCSYCGGSVEHIDHIHPVSRGGRSDWDNLAPACAACNRRKNAKPLLRFLLERQTA